jgi:hypothetical protein
MCCYVRPCLEEDQQRLYGDKTHPTTSRSPGGGQPVKDVGGLLHRRLGRLHLWSQPQGYRYLNLPQGSCLSSVLTMPYGFSMVLPIIMNSHGMLHIEVGIYVFYVTFNNTVFLCASNDFNQKNKKLISIMWCFYDESPESPAGGPHGPVRTDSRLVEPGGRSFATGRCSRDGWPGCLLGALDKNNANHLRHRGDVKRSSVWNK